MVIAFIALTLYQILSGLDIIQNVLEAIHSFYDTVPFYKKYCAILYKRHEGVFMVIWYQLPLTKRNDHNVNTYHCASSRKAIKEKLQVSVSPHFSHLHQHHPLFLQGVASATCPPPQFLSVGAMRMSSTRLPLQGHSHLWSFFKPSDLYDPEAKHEPLDGMGIGE